MTQAWRTALVLWRMRKCKWTKEQLVESAKKCQSIRQLLTCLGIIGAGGNYRIINKFLKLYQIDTSHFTGRGWRKGTKTPMTPPRPLEQLLILGGEYQSFKLKRRLYTAGLKSCHCEECGWAKTSADGRIPLELDHINGNRTDNRLENLRILCPNCHSLKPTHRGLNRRNKAQKRPGGEIGQTQEA